MSFPDYYVLQLDINIKTKGKKPITWKFLLFILKESFESIKNANKNAEYYKRNNKHHKSESVSYI